MAYILIVIIIFLFVLLLKLQNNNKKYINERADFKSKYQENIDDLNEFSFKVEGTELPKIQKNLSLIAKDLLHEKVIPYNGIEDSNMFDMDRLKKFWEIKYTGLNDGIYLDFLEDKGILKGYVQNTKYGLIGFVPEHIVHSLYDSYRSTKRHDIFWTIGGGNYKFIDMEDYSNEDKIATGFMEYALNIKVKNN